MRSNYVLGLQLVPTAPLTHGMGNDGNQQILRRQEYRIPVTDPETLEQTWEEVEVPCVSGAALKATLREHSLWHLIDALGLRDQPLSMDALRLLLKGGKVESSGSGISLERHRRLRRIFPLLAVFGWMDESAGTGQIQVSDVRPWCSELLAAGLLDEVLRPLHVGPPPAADDGIRLCELPPIGVHQVTTERQYYSHDLRNGHAARLLAVDERQALEDQAAAQKGQQLPAEKRRAVNESMPHAFEAIAPGVPLVAVVRLSDATEIEWDCLRWAIFRWISTGGHLGGGSTKGHGACKVQIRGALSYVPGRGEALAQPGSEITTDRAGQAYLAHLAATAEEIRAELAAVAKAPAAEKPKKGKAKKAAEIDLGLGEEVDA